jgi:hypothetical protein
MHGPMKVRSLKTKAKEHVLMTAAKEAKEITEY